MINRCVQKIKKVTDVEERLEEIYDGAKTNKQK